MNVGRIGATATTLRSGQVLVAGGLGPKLEALRSAELFDPSSMTWRETTPLPQTRFAQSATLLPNGQVLLVGGIVAGSISSTALFFDPGSEQWLPAPDNALLARPTDGARARRRADPDGRWIRTTGNLRPNATTVATDCYHVVPLPPDCGGTTRWIGLDCIWSRSRCPRFALRPRVPTRYG